MSATGGMLTRCRLPLVSTHDCGSRKLSRRPAVGVNIRTATVRHQNVAARGNGAGHTVGTHGGLITSGRVGRRTSGRQQVDTLEGKLT